MRHTVTNVLIYMKTVKGLKNIGKWFTYSSVKFVLSREQARLLWKITYWINNFSLIKMVKFLVTTVGRWALGRRTGDRCSP